jgi:hypothetical protein
MALDNIRCAGPCAAGHRRAGEQQKWRACPATRPKAAVGYSGRSMLQGRKLEIQGTGQVAACV